MVACGARAKGDVGGGGQTVSARGVQALRTAIVDGTDTSAHVLSASVAVGHDDVVRCAGGIAVKGGTDERDVRVGGVKPVVELVHGDYVGNLKDASEHERQVSNV